MRLTSTDRRALLLTALAGTLGLFDWTQPRQASAQAGTPPATLSLTGLARDFVPTHPDFSAGITDHAALSAGNLSATTGADGLPVYTGQGKIVTTSAVDKDGRPIAPALAKAAPVTDFTIGTGSRVTSTVPVAAKVTVLGAAITYGGAYPLPVTMQVNAAGTVIQPFGSFTGPYSGNVNKSDVAFSSVLPQMVQPGQSISIDAKSWTRKNSGVASTRDTDYSLYMTVNSATGGSNVIALRNGSPVPNVGGFDGQVSAKDIVGDYIDSATHKMKLAANQVIYLFELGSTDSRSSAFDMQDLVVLVELADSPAYFNPPTDPSPAPACFTAADRPAALGAADLGAINSTNSFAQWFGPAPGVSVSEPLAITLTRGSDGVYRYSSAAFHPLDGRLFGNPAGSHNSGFTYMIDARFSYCGCTGQFFEFSGDGDLWVFINGKLVMDLGGGHPSGRQVIDMDRLGLTNGASTHFQLFYAQRSTGSNFNVSTNIPLDTAGSIANIPMPPLAD